MHEKVLLLTFFVCFVFKPRGHETNYSKPSVSGSLQIVGDLGENHIKLWGSIGAAVAEAIWMLHKWLSQHLDACKAPVSLYGSSLKPCKSVDSHVTVCFRSNTACSFPLCSSLFKNNNKKTLPSLCEQSSCPEHRHLDLHFFETHK